MDRDHWLDGGWCPVEAARSGALPWLLSSLVALSVGACAADTSEHPDMDADADVDADADADADVDADVDADADADPDAALPDYRDGPCVGEPGETRVFDHDALAFVSVRATCRAQGLATRVYVEDDLWERDVTQEQVNAFMHRFELLGPRESIDPETGALFVVQRVFGELDASQLPDGLLHVYVLDSDGYGDGYMCPTAMGWCDFYSLHLDGLLLDLESDEAVSVAAHETAHIIQAFVDADEEPWIDESLAEAAMLVSGYYTDEGWVRDFLRRPDQDWGPGDPGHGGGHYGAFLLWGAFLWELGGTELLGAVAGERRNGWDGIDAALGSLSLGVTSRDVFLDFVVTLGVGEPELGFGFAFADVGPARHADPVAPGEEARGEVSPWGADFLPVDATDAVEVAVAADGEITVLGVVSDAEGVAVSDLTGGGALEIDAGASALLAVTAATDGSYVIGIR